MSAAPPCHSAGSGYTGAAPTCDCGHRRDDHWNNGVEGTECRRCSCVCFKLVYQEEVEVLQCVANDRAAPQAAANDRIGGEESGVFAIMEPAA